MYKFLENNNNIPKSLNKTSYACILARMMRTVYEIFLKKKRTTKYNLKKSISAESQFGSTFFLIQTEKHSSF